MSSTSSRETLSPPARAGRHVHLSADERAYEPFAEAVGSGRLEAQPDL